MIVKKIISNQIDWILAIVSFKFHPKDNNQWGKNHLMKSLSDGTRIDTWEKLPFVHQSISISPYCKFPHLLAKFPRLIKRLYHLFAQLSNTFLATPCLYIPWYIHTMDMNLFKIVLSHAYLFCWVAPFQSDLTTTVFLAKAEFEEEDPEWKLWTVVPLSIIWSLDASHRWTWNNGMQI